MCSAILQGPPSIWVPRQHPHPALLPHLQPSLQVSLSLTGPGPEGSVTVADAGLAASLISAGQAQTWGTHQGQEEGWPPVSLAPGFGRPTWSQTHASSSHPSLEEPSEVSHQKALNSWWDSFHGLVGSTLSDSPFYPMAP